MWMGTLRLAQGTYAAKVQPLRQAPAALVWLCQKEVLAMSMRITGRRCPGRKAEKAGEHGALKLSFPGQQLQGE